MKRKNDIIYNPNYKELNSMRICHKNNLAYVVVPNGKNKYWISKYNLNNLKYQIFLEENNIRKEFNKYDADKKIMELYTQHSKRFNK